MKIKDRFIKEASEILDTSAARGDFSDAHILFDPGSSKSGNGADEEQVFELSFGSTENKMFDIASLTKVVSTWFLIGQAIERGDFSLNSYVGDILGHPSAPSGHVTIQNILSHRSGLMAETMLGGYASNADLIEQILLEPLAGIPGNTYKYLNRGFILLGACIESIRHKPLRAVFTEDVANRIGMASTVFGPVDPTSSIPTSIHPDGSNVPPGHVHDANADLLGGAAGHAGLFSTAKDLHAFATAVNRIFNGAWTDYGIGQNYALMSTSKLAQHDDDSYRGLAWLNRDTIAGPCIFHYGFTGTALFLFPKSGASLVILTNSVKSCGGRPRINQLRDELYSLALSCL